MKVLYSIDAFAWNPVKGQYDLTEIAQYRDFESAREVFDKTAVSDDMPQISIERCEDWGDDCEVERLVIKYLVHGKEVVEEYDV